MSELSAEQRSRVDALIDELLDLPESARAQRLDAPDVDDPGVRAEVESLLQAARAATGFLSTPAHPAVESLDAGMAAGTALGAWRIGRRVGRGGMGEVYEAARTQGGFEQRVAVKVLQLEAGSQAERFLAERQILARLEHPGIARLHDGGLTEDGRPYMAMEFVAGQPITVYCELMRAGLQQRLQLFLHVCEAVAYAHSNLVVHRDLKPSNILVSQDGQVKLLDFGIAKLIDAERAQLTTTAAVPLTPVCAAPEQLSGGPVTTATDVYALGLLLFELLTGVHPWIGPDAPVLQALRTLMSRPVPLASRIAAEHGNAPVPARLILGDLDAIVSKALREEPGHRYATVEALRLDVARVLRGEAVEAREGARFYVFGRMLRRYRWAALAIAAVFVSLAGGLGVAAWQARQAQIERDAARRDAAREEAVRYNLTRMFRTAIADQGGSQPATAKSMIDESALRVLREYRDRPQLAGQLVLALSDLYGALEDVAGAGSLLDGFVTQAGPDADPLALADARQKLANIELLRGHPDRAATLLDQADDYWRQAPQGNAEERLEGLGIRARLQRMRGDVDGAIATNRQAIAARIALSGRDHRETAVLYNSLAISLTAANRLDEALAAYRETTRIYRAVGLGDGLDAQVILGNIGTLELRTGHLQEAQTLLKTAVEHERELAGDSAAVAAAMGYYGRVLAIENRGPEAIPVLRESVSLAARYAGAKSPVTVQNEVFLGEAQTATGDQAGAQQTLTAARTAALAQYGESHPLTQRTRLAVARLAAANDPQGALTQLFAVVSALRALGPPAAPYLAQALESLGELRLASGHPQSAVESLTEAVALQQRVNDRTWESAITRERLGEAAAALGRAEAAGLLRSAAQDLETQLGREHPQTLRAQRALAQLTR